MRTSGKSNRKRCNNFIYFLKTTEQRKHQTATSRLRLNSCCKLRARTYSSQARTAWYEAWFSMLSSSEASSFLQMCHVWAGSLENQQINPAQQMLEAKTCLSRAKRECGDNIGLSHPTSDDVAGFLFETEMARMEHKTQKSATEKRILWSRSDRKALRYAVNSQ